MSMVSGSLRKLPTAQQSPAEQKAFFDQHGFAIVRGCLSQGELEDCAAAVRELHERAAAGQPGQFQFEPFAKDFLTEDHLPVLRKIERTDDLSPVFHRLARHPKIVATWQNVIGDENLLLFRSTLMLKPAHHGSAHALHQDAAVRFIPKFVSNAWMMKLRVLELRCRAVHAVLAAASCRLGSRCECCVARRGFV